MEQTLFTKIVTTESRRSSSTVDLPNMSGSTAIGHFKMVSNIASSPSPTVDCISISQPSTPIPTTPLFSCGTTTPPNKRVISLDLEMRSRKRRRGYAEEDCIIYFASSTTSLSLPKLIALEDCSDSHETRLPDTSFLHQKKPLRRRRRTIIWSDEWSMSRSSYDDECYGNITSRITVVNLSNIIVYVIICVNTWTTAIHRYTLPLFTSKIVHLPSMVLPEFWCLRTKSYFKNSRLESKRCSSFSSFMIEGRFYSLTTSSPCIQTRCNNDDPSLRYDISNYPCKCDPPIDHISTKLFRIIFRNGARCHVDQDLNSSWNIGNSIPCSPCYYKQFS